MIKLSQNELTMLLFTRIVGLGYLFNLIVYEGQWAVAVLFSAAIILLTSYSCYLTIELRDSHQNAI